MILAGCEGPNKLTVDQAQSQFAFWAINSAPLIMSNDLRTIGEEYKKILQNKGMIAIDQDERGAMALPVVTGSNGVWVKPLAATNEVAVLFYNWNDDGRGLALNIACPVERIVPDAARVVVHDVILDKRSPDKKRGEYLTFDVVPDGVVMVKLTVSTADGGESNAWKTGNFSTSVGSNDEEPLPCIVSHSRHQPL